MIDSRGCDFQRCEQPYLNGQSPVTCLLSFTCVWMLWSQGCYGVWHLLGCSKKTIAMQKKKNVPNNTLIITRRHSVVWLTTVGTSFPTPSLQSASAIVCRKQVLWGWLMTGRGPQRWRFHMQCKMTICDIFREVQRACNLVFCLTWPFWGQLKQNTGLEALFWQNSSWNTTGTASAPRGLCSPSILPPPPPPPWVAPFSS